MPVSPEDTARHLRRRDEERERRGQARAHALRERLSMAHEELARRGALRIWLFGSLATGHTTENSDVDLAVEGLPSEVYFDALTALMTLFRGPVDLVRIEEACDSLRERILAEGESL